MKIARYESVTFGSYQSAYWKNALPLYGKYCFNVKLSHLNEDELTAIQDFYFLDEDYIQSELSELGIKASYSFEGRSGGWLTIHEDLTIDQFTALKTRIAEFRSTVKEFAKQLISDREQIA